MVSGGWESAHGLAEVLCLWVSHNAAVSLRLDWKGSNS